VKERIIEQCGADLFELPKHIEKDTLPSWPLLKTGAWKSYKKVKVLLCGACSEPWLQSHGV